MVLNHATIRGILKRMSPVAEQQQPKISAADAAYAAKEYFRALFPNVHKFSLEEVELSEDGLYWMITLGYEIPKDLLEASAFFQPPSTKFKVFKVNAQTGQVLSMKIRSLQ
jgi:hypothetical protein